jgi:hypothetical protein
LLALVPFALLGVAGCGDGSDDDGGSNQPERAFEDDTGTTDDDTATTGDDTATTGDDTATTGDDATASDAGEPHKFHAIVKVAGYRGECEVSGAVGHYAYGVKKRSCFGSFTDNWPWSGPGGNGDPPFQDGPDRSSFSWDATQPGKVQLKIRNESKNATLWGYSPSANSPHLFVTGGDVSSWKHTGPITSGTDESKNGQPGGPLNINVQYSKASKLIKPLKAGYWINLNGYLNYATK